MDDLTYEAGMRLHDLKPEVPPDDRDRASLVMRHFADSLTSRSCRDWPPPTTRGG